MKHETIEPGEIIRAFTPTQLRELVQSILPELPLVEQIAVGRTLAHEMSCFDLAGERIDQGLDFAEQELEQEQRVVELGLYAVTVKVNPWNAEAWV